MAIETRYVLNVRLDDGYDGFIDIERIEGEVPYPLFLFDSMDAVMYTTDLDEALTFLEAFDGYIKNHMVGAEVLSYTVEIPDEPI